MSDEIERLLVRVEGNVAHLEAQMKKANRAIWASQAENRKALTAIKRDTTAMSRTMFQPVGDAFRKEVAGLSGILAGLFTAGQVTKYADAYTGLQNRLRATGLEGKALKATEDALYDAANRNGVAVAATAELYQRAAMARQNLGASEEDLQRIVSGTAAALKVQGTSATAASGALLQLGQLLGGNMVQAQEYNSLIDQMPVLLQAVASGSDRWGGSVNKLTRDVKDGKVSVQDWTKAMLKGFAEIQATADSAAPTIAGALQSLDNAFGRYIGQTDTSLSASQRLAQGIILLSDNLDTIAPIVVTLAGLIGGAYAISLTTAAVRTGLATASNIAYQAALVRLQARQTGATGAQIALNAAMAANPIGLVVTAVAVLAAGLYLLASRYSSSAQAARALDHVVGEADTALEDYRKAVLAARDASKEERVELEKKAAALRAVTLARINDAKVEAQKQIDEAVAARARADSEIQRSRETRDTVGTNAGSNAGAALVGGARSSAQGAISLAARARAEADTAIQAYERLKDTMEEIENPRQQGGGVTTTDGSAGGGKASADRIADLRARLDLEERMAAARATGDKQAIELEEERQRLVELTERYREAGYADAAVRAMQMVAAENQAKDIEESRERLAERRREQAEFEATLKQRALEWTQRQYDQELELARIQGDQTVIRRLEREAELRQRIAEYTERYGLAGYGLAVAEQAKFDSALNGQEAADRLDETSRAAARHFVDVLAADSWAEAAGQKFRQAAFDGLEDLLTSVFKQLGSGESGGVLGSIAKGIGTLFGGGRASGGPVTAGRAYRINENTAKSEIFVPGVSGRVITAAQAAAGQGANPVRQQPIILQMAVEEGAMFAPRVQAISGQVSVQTTAAGVAYSQDQARTATRRRRQSLV